MAEEKKMVCCECQATYKVIDEDADHRGRKFLLLECSGCSRCIIAPEQPSQEASAGTRE